MPLPRRKSQRKLKPQKPTEPLPLTQDWADAIHTLMSSATLAAELEEPFLQSLLLSEVRRILRRGDPSPDPIPVEPSLPLKLSDTH